MFLWAGSGCSSGPVLGVPLVPRVWQVSLDLGATFLRLHLDPRFWVFLWAGSGCSSGPVLGYIALVMASLCVYKDLHY